MGTVETNGKAGNDNRIEKRITLLTYLLVAMMILLFLVIMYLIYFSGKPVEQVVPKTSQSEVNTEEYLDSKVEEGMLRITIQPTLNFKGLVSEGNTGVINHNSNTYAQVLRIVSEGGKLLYTSERLEVGDSLDSITLADKLETGSYNCVAYFDAVDNKNEVIGTAGANITVIVQ